MQAKDRFTECLERIDRLDERLRAFLTVVREPGGSDGPIVALKDNIETAGVRTTYASRFFADHVPEEDAEVWARLRAAGAVIVGKTNLHEFAFGATTQNPWWGNCRNPWDLSESPAARAAAPVPPSRPACATSRSARTRAVRCGFPRRSAA